MGCLDQRHMSPIYKLKTNFCGCKKEGHFHYKNFESFKMSTHMTYLHGRHKILLSDWLTENCSQSESRDFVPTV